MPIVNATLELLVGIATILLATVGIGVGALGSMVGAVMMIDADVRRIGAAFAAVSLPLFGVSAWALIGVAG